MSKGPPKRKEQIYSIVLADAENIKKQTEAQLSVLNDLIENYTNDDITTITMNAMSLICESFSTNYKLNKLISTHIETSPTEIYEGTEEILINEVQMTLLQTLTLSQYMISLELERDENISTALH